MALPLPLLQKTTLFAGFSCAELEALLPQLQPAVRRYAAGATLLPTGSDTSQMGIVLEGGIEAAKYTRAGEAFIVARMGPGGIFGDVLAAGRQKSPVTVRAAQESRVLLLESERLFAAPGADAGLHRRLLVNLVGVIAGKYFQLDRRIDLLLTRGLRRRIADYLLDAGRGQGTGGFCIPYTRAELAAYLGCERSALSRELSAMAAEGLIETTRRHFRIPNEQKLRQLF